MKKIEKLEPSPHVQGRFLIWIEGEQSPVKVTENEVLSFALYQGKQLEDAEYSELLHVGQASMARARGARMLGERPLSRKELVSRLQSKGFSAQDCADAADWLEEIGALNEAAYAASIVRHYSARGYGRRRMEQELRQRGIPYDLWEQALEEQSAPVDQVVHFLESRFRGKEPDAKDLKRATDALLRRGFHWEEVKTGLARYGTILEEELP